MSPHGETCRGCECPIEVGGNQYWHWSWCPAVARAQDPTRRGRVFETSTPKKLHAKKRAEIREEIRELQNGLKSMRPPEKDTCLDEVHLTWIDYRTEQREAA